MCDGNMLSRAPELKIGLVNDIMCGLIQVDICQSWTSRYMPELDIIRTRTLPVGSC